MISSQAAATFFLASVVLALVPGPDNVFVMMQAATRGPLAGMRVVLGLCTGLVVHTTAVVVGVAGLMAASPIAFTILKVVGATYLAWLAFQAMSAKIRPIEERTENIRNGWKLYARGILMNVTNPKVSVFFLAFLPQFTSDNETSVSVQLIILGSLFILATLIVFGTIAFFAGAFGNKLRRSPQIQRWLNHLSALVFVGLALHLLLE